MNKQLPPGPKGVPFLGNLPDFGRDPLDFLTKCAEKYGDVVRIRFEKKNEIFLINHPHYIKDVLMNSNRIFAKGYQKDPIMSLLLGNGLLTSEGDFWMRQRRLLAPAFHHQRIDSYSEVMVSFAERMAVSWEDGEIRDIHADMMKLTMEIVVKTLFDTDLHENGDELSHALETVLTEFNTQLTSSFRRILSLLPFKIPHSGDLRLNEAVEHLERFIYHVIQERRVHNEDRGDLLSMLLQAQDDDGSKMSDTQLRDEVLTLFLAGHETTANTLSWTWYLIAQSPEVEEKMLAEIENVLGSRNPNISDLSQLVYTHHVIKEAMRLYPPAWIISREALVDCEFGGYHIPAGSEVSMSQWVMHHDSRYFDEPLKFKPERWQDDLEKNLPKYAYFPFGGGPRICIGNNFAMMEAVLLLVTIIRHFRFELFEKDRVLLEPSITLRPKHGIKVLLRAR